MTMAQEDVTTIARQIAQLSKRLQTVESQIHGLNSSMQSFSKLGEHAATCQPESVKNEMQAMRADILDLARKFGNVRDTLATGHGITHSTAFSKEDYAEMLPAKLAETSLADVALTIAASKGIDLRNRNELDAFLMPKIKAKEV